MGRCYECPTTPHAEYRALPLSASGHRHHRAGGYTSGMSELVFFKSSYSAGENECVEVAFRKSSYSGSQSACVEVADLPAGTAIRDSKHPERGHLDIPRSEWAAFLCSAT
ncbi:DUF397 domain-containing protein [Nocardiopsis sp. NPDC006198]|uniref:DUF397 domain-containing protein n=1 Tax=Nocardiopsis sp. NPDC006198 TaxID=3154472 RepID=UPI0033ACF336